MIETLEELAGEVRTWLSRKPSDAGAILRVVADAMAAYEEACKVKRNALADSALLNVLDPSFIAKMPVHCSIDAVFHQFPVGLGENRAVREIACWEAFVKRCHRPDGMNEKWLRDVKGEEYFAWYRKYVLPLI